MSYTKVRKIEDGIWLLDNGRYLVDIRPGGSHDQKRHRKSKKTKMEAVRYKRRVQSSADAGEDWKPDKKDNRLLSALVDLWYKQHGHTLKSGESRKGRLLHLVKILNDPPAYKFDGDTYLKLRVQRQAADASANTCNHDLAYFKAMYSRLVKAGKVQANPLIYIEPLKFAQSEITYLELTQVSELLDSLRAGKSPDAYAISTICLSTGCRWGEAETLRGEMVKGGRIQFTDTKNLDSRAVPIDADLENYLKENYPRIGRMFKLAYGGFTTGLGRAEIKLPRGQRTHVLRHTFGVQFMRGRGNILDLQKILGHKTLHQTLRYAQFHPDYVKDALFLNPLAQLKKLKQSKNAAENE